MSTDQTILFALLFGLRPAARDPDRAGRDPDHLGGLAALILT
jgi:hypothetical protein